MKLKLFTSLRELHNYARHVAAWHSYSYANRRGIEVTASGPENVQLHVINSHYDINSLKGMTFESITPSHFLTTYPELRFLLPRDHA